jgi:hypothetical protein
MYVVSVSLSLLPVHLQDRHQSLLSLLSQSVMWMEPLRVRSDHEDLPPVQGDEFDAQSPSTNVNEEIYLGSGSSMFVLDDEWALTAGHTLFPISSYGGRKGAPCLFAQNYMAYLNAFTHVDPKSRLHQCSSVEASGAEEVMMKPGYITFDEVQWREQHGGYWDNFTLSLHNVKNGYLLLRLKPRAGLPFAFARRFAPSTLRPRVNDTVLAIGYSSISDESDPVRCGQGGHITGVLSLEALQYIFGLSDLAIGVGRVTHENEFAFLHEASTGGHAGGPVLLLDELLRGLDSDGQWPLDRPFPFVGITQGGTDFGYSIASSVHHPGFKAHFKQFEKAQKRKAAEKKKQEEAQQTAEKQEL